MYKQRDKAKREEFAAAKILMLEQQELARAYETLVKSVNFENISPERLALGLGILRGEIDPVENGRYISNGAYFNINNLDTLVGFTAAEHIEIYISHAQEKKGLTKIGLVLQILTCEPGKIFETMSHVFKQQAVMAGITDPDLIEAYGNIMAGYASGLIGRQISAGIAALGKGNPNIPKLQVDEILETPKGSRPDPSTYLSKDYIASHLKEFENGATKIMTKAPTGTVGPPDGTFVMPSSVADDIIAQANGSISKLEELLGFPKGSLGNNPVRVDIPAPHGLRIPSGNEPGANSKWIPGGYTSGGTLEAIINPVPPGKYTIKPIS